MKRTIIILVGKRAAGKTVLARQLTLKEQIGESLDFNQGDFSCRDVALKLCAMRNRRLVICTENVVALVVNKTFRKIAKDAEILVSTPGSAAEAQSSRMSVDKAACRKPAPDGGRGSSPWAEAATLRTSRPFSRRGALLRRRRTATSRIIS